MTRRAKDEAAFRQEARWRLDQPIDGISSGGSTGEGALLSDAEAMLSVSFPRP